MPPAPDAAAEPRTVRSFLSRFRAEILAEWQRVVREIPVASELPPIALADHVAELLDQVAELADEVADSPASTGTLETARRHAVDRLGAGFDVAAVVRELSFLRGCTLVVWGRERGARDDDARRALDVVFDRAIEASVARYVEARDRTLAALDTISTASLEATSLADLLQRLLTVFLRTTASVQTCAILLRDDDGQLRTHATVGLEAERVRAFHSLPLVQDGRAIGVAHMGSLTASQFSQEDKQLFASMCARATVGIHHHMLRERLVATDVRAREVAAERERALAKLEALLAAAPVGMGFLDRDLRYLRLNEALAALNGKPASDHVGRTVAEVLPDHAGALLPLLARVLATGESVNNVPLTGPDGRALLATYFPVRDGSGGVSGVGGIVLDVTEERRAHDALRAEEARLQSILEHTPAAIWVKDAEGRIVLANRRLADALGCDYARLVGHRSEDVLPPEVAQPHRDHDLAVMRENRSMEVEEVVPVPGGVRTFLSIKFPIPSDPPLVGGIATEITHRKRMEEELRAAVRAREEVLAVVSHDLRNPLGAVRLAASMLLAQSSTDSRARRQLDLIHRASHRMEMLIDDLLDTANIGAGRLKLETKREPADALLREGLELQQPLAAEKGLRLERAGDVEGVEVVCDRDRILQVFANLIGNALKFCRAGDAITVVGERAGDHVRFSVVDTGPGIAPAALPRLFDAYWSGVDQGKRGVGLGLYISRGIVEAHGGRLSVESTPGAGATFSFTLPVSS